MITKAFNILLMVLLLPPAACSNGQKDNTRLNVSEVLSGEGDTLFNRKPAVAGSFYPANRDALMNQLAALFKEGTPNRNLDHVVALISPHAGYGYSGKIAASAYNQLQGKKYDNVFIIGASHYVNFSGAAFYCEGNFITPLGVAKVNIPLARQIIRDNPTLFVSNGDVHSPEHSIEVQIPFLQYLYKDDLQIIPILLGTQKPVTIRKIADALQPYFNGSNLFIFSTDFSHYPNYTDACKVDAITADAILTNSSEAFLKAIESNDSKGIPNLATSICGWTGVLTMLDITEKKPGIHYVKLNYMNSGDSPEGDKTRVVGYNAIAVVSDPEPETAGRQDHYSLTKGEKDQLLRIARSTISHYLQAGEVTKIDTKGFPDKLMAHAGAFVTLTMNGQLRGCIGQFTADIPLYQVVQEMAISAATRDYRFKTLTLGELNQTDIEISVLTPMKRVESTDEIELGRHGIYIKKGNHAGTFLPQVADQTGWTREEFLGHCARDKAGIGWDGWKDAEIYIYEAYVFGE